MTETDIEIFLDLAQRYIRKAQCLPVDDQKFFEFTTKASEILNKIVKEREQRG